jgi:hypothetical protein
MIDLKNGKNMVPKKVAVMNFGSKAGCSTVAKHLLLPKQIDSEFAGGIYQIKNCRSPEAFGDLYTSIMFEVIMADSKIIDASAQGAKYLLGELRANPAGAHKQFDAFVIPTAAKTIPLIETIETIDALVNLGVPANKIVVIFNAIDRDENILNSLSNIPEYHKKTMAFKKLINASMASVIYKNELLFRYMANGESLESFISVDVATLKVQLKTASTAEEKMVISKKIVNCRLAENAQNNFNQVFKSLFVPEALEA